MLPPHAGQRACSTARRYRCGAAPRRLQRGVAYCSADRKRDGIFAERPIRENLSSPWIRSVAPGGWISARRERERAREIAARFAIDVKRLGSAVGTLSGGNQQKVAVGKWLGAEPEGDAARGADARRRHRRAGRDLPAAPRPLRRRPRHRRRELRHRRGARPFRHDRDLLPWPPHRHQAAGGMDRGRPRSAR